MLLKDIGQNFYKNNYFILILTYHGIRAYFHPFLLKSNYGLLLTDYLSSKEKMEAPDGRYSEKTQSLCC